MTAEAQNTTMTLTISRQRLYDVLVSANENGSGYWARVTKTHLPEEPEVSWLAEAEQNDVSRWPEHLAPLVGGYTQYAEVDEATGALSSERFVLNARTIAIGLQRLAEGSPRVLAAIIEGTFDAGDADMFLQYCLLGELRYG